MFVWGGGPSGGFAAAILIWGRQARAGLRPAAPSAEGRSPPPRKLIPEVGAGVDGLPLHHDLVVKVRARGAPGIAGVTDHLAPLDPLALLHGGLREVAVERADVLAVVENDRDAVLRLRAGEGDRPFRGGADRRAGLRVDIDRKSTRLNSSHLVISYAVFCLKKKTIGLRDHVAHDTPARGNRGARKCLRASIE